MNIRLLKIRLLIQTSLLFLFIAIVLLISIHKESIIRLKLVE